MNDSPLDVEIQSSKALAANAIFTLSHASLNLAVFRYISLNSTDR